MTHYVRRATPTPPSSTCVCHTQQCSITGENSSCLQRKPRTRTTYLLHTPGPWSPSSTETCTDLPSSIATEGYLPSIVLRRHCVTTPVIICLGVFKGENVWIYGHLDCQCITLVRSFLCGVVFFPFFSCCVASMDHPGPWIVRRRYREQTSPPGKY